MFLLDGSVRTAWALLISLNFSAADASSGFLSGWYRRANFLPKLKVGGKALAVYQKLQYHFIKDKVHLFIFYAYTYRGGVLSFILLATCLKYKFLLKDVICSQCAETIRLFLPPHPQRNCR